MQTKLLEILACPECQGELRCTTSEVHSDGDIEGGSLQCQACRRTFPIQRGIPRFVKTDNYASSFGYQWNYFRSQQIDSVNGTELSRKRFYSETNWTPEWMESKLILDAGCGAGRFLDIASGNDCQVVGVDISNATDAARSTVGGRRNVHLVQASIYQLPFRPAVFDGCYSIGVIQHTPDPEKAVRSLPRILKPDGRIALTIYERRRWTMWHSKYLIRPLTKRMNKAVLLFSIKCLMPFVFPLTEVAFRLPGLGKLFSFAIPVANYVDERELSLGQRYDWALLDTFDMLSPEYDQPQTEEVVTRILRDQRVVDIQRLPTGGLNLIGRRAG